MHVLDSLERHNLTYQNKELLAYMSYFQLVFLSHDAINLYEGLLFLQPHHLILKSNAKHHGLPGVEVQNLSLNF